ncbi:hypothetical protein DM02DRAFT_649014 [Periconia macrospinosa]|uniref:DNA mismatch repair protein MSH5 n=1 Tax=Periconia macrospinosa TaxID=97972 RepID=A0A2V1ECG6_9PLEO|nr:hypothetical protein DM02DRAFT_649014 [Periconia macrospinosa]
MKPRYERRDPTRSSKNVRGSNSGHNVDHEKVPVFSPAMSSSSTIPASSSSRLPVLDDYQHSCSSLPQECPPEPHSDDDTLNEIIMAVDMQHRDTVGCSYYVAREEKLYCMEDVQLGGVDVVDALKLYIDPTVIIVSTKVDDGVVHHLDPDAGSIVPGEQHRNEYRLSFLFELRPPNEFSFEAAKNKLSHLMLHDVHQLQCNFAMTGDAVLSDTAGVGETSDGHGQQGRLLHLAGLIDMDSRLTIGCAGAILTYLQRRRAAAYLPGDPDAHHMFQVSKIEMFSLKETMFINSDTLHSLRILEDESHPNSHNQGPSKVSSGSKEGLSVYGLFHHFARTPQGRCRLRQIFLRPSLNLDIIEERLETIRIFILPENSEATSSLIESLKAVGNMRIVVSSLKKGAGGGGFRGKPAAPSNTIWSRIQKFTFFALRITDAICEVIGGRHLPIVTKVLDQVERHHLANIGKRISEIVDLDTSAEETRTVIQPGVDEELDQMKHVFEGLSPLLLEVARKLSEKMPASIQGSLNVIYYPQIGFLVTVPVEPTTGEAVYAGNFDNPWEQIFVTEEQFYFKNNEMREMDSHFGDLYGMISEREIDISHELAQHVLEYEEVITHASDIFGELDSLLALAQGAQAYNLHCPHMTLDNIIDIKGGRHILQEYTLSANFVPNDTLLSGGMGDEDSKIGQGDGPSLLILTGPNYSGKSVYLTQVALIVYMAHIGSFVPAENATIGITDKILSRVATRETVSRAQSTFMIDLQQMSLALSLATRRSLLIIDEFGKGTDTSDGAGLAAAIFKYLVDLGNQRMKVLAATHFHEIFENNLLPPSSRLAFGHMEVCVNEMAPEPEDQVTYLYNFRDGRSNSSFGACCAAINGIPTEIVSRADELIAMAIRGEDLVAACASMPTDEFDELTKAEHMARKFLEQENFDDPEINLGELLRELGS